MFNRCTHEDDVFIVDRGFRDSLDILEDLGIRAEMPRLLSKGQKQMTTSDANASRLVTKVIYSSLFLKSKMNKKYIILYVYFH